MPTPEQARAELARRELAKRQQPVVQEKGGRFRGAGATGTFGDKPQQLATAGMTYPYIPEEEAGRRERAVKATSRGVARVGAAGANVVRGFIGAETPGAPYAQAQEKGRKETIKKLEDTGQLLWEVSKDPEIAAVGGDTLDKIIDLTFENIPYMAATTGAYALAGPAGGFVVGAAVEGNNARQTARDFFRQQNQGKELTPEQERHASRVGWGVGIIAGAIETIGGKGAEKLAQRAISKLNSKMAAGAATFGAGTIIESLEEAGQELAAIGGEETYRDVDWNESVKRVTGAMAGGAFLGGAFKTAAVAGRGAFQQPGRAQPVSEAGVPQAIRPGEEQQVNVYKTVSGSRTGITEQEVVREGERYVDSVTGEDVILDQEASGSAIERPAGAIEETETERTRALREKDIEAERIRESDVRGVEAKRAEREAEFPGRNVAKVENEIRDLLSMSEGEKDPGVLKRIADAVEKRDAEIDPIREKNLHGADFKKLHKLAKKQGIDVPKGTTKTGIKRMLQGPQDIVRTDTGFALLLPVAEGEAGRAWSVDRYPTYQKAKEAAVRLGIELPELVIPTQEEIGEAIPVGGEKETDQTVTPEQGKKPRVRVRAKARSKKELLWRGHTLPEALGMDEESRRQLMEEVTGKKSMKDMSPKEQEMFVAYLEGLAEQQGVEPDAPVIDKAIEQLDKLSKRKGELTPTEELHQSSVAKLVNSIKSWASEAYHVMQRIERFIETLDGEEDGILHENVWKVAKKGDETAIANTAAGVEEMIRLLEENSIDTSLFLGKVEEVASGVKLTRSEQVGVYLLSQNENGLKYLIEGMGISEEVINEVIGNLSQTELMISDWLRNQYESQWPTIIAAAEQAGIDPAEFVKELRYSPIIRSDVDPLDQVDFVDMLTEGFTKESFKPEQGFLEQRKKRAVGKIELDALTIYLNNVRRIERFKAMAPVAKKVGAILRNQGFKDSLNNATYGHGSKLLNTWLRDTIKGYSPSESGLFAKTLQTLRRNSIVYAIGYNIPSSLRQALSLSNAMAVNPLMTKYVPVNMAKATKNFAQLRDEVHSKSSLVSTRDYERDLRQRWNRESLQKKLKGKDPFDQKATAWIRWMDRRTVVVAWKSLYDTAVEQGKDEKAAIEYADKWVARTQPMANAKDLPQFFRDGQLAKIISVFQNQVNNNWNFYTHDIIGAKLSPQMIAYRTMFSLVLPAIAYGMIGRGGLPKSWKQLAVDLVTYPIASMMLVGRLINRTILGWDNSTSIVETGPEAIVKTGKAIVRGDVKGTIKGAAETIGAIGGHGPTAQMSRTFTGAMDLAAGNTQDPRRLIWSEWALDQGKESGQQTRRSPSRRPPTRRPPR